MVIVIGLLVFLVLVVLMVPKKKEPDFAKETNARNATNEKHNRKVYYSRFDLDKYTEPQAPDELDIAGITFENRLSVCYSCTKGEELMLDREPDNPHDPNAIRLIRFNGDVLGYLTWYDAKRYAPILDEKILVKAYFDFIVYSDRYDAYVNLIEYKPNETTNYEETNE